jgi:glycosyltransferase involved in cell wall biosynthesis
MIRPVPPEKLSGILRQHDIYITASQHEACSNSVLEALSCGLPVLYLDSGSHTEIVKEAGCGFSSHEEIPELLNGLVDDYESYQAKISIPNLSEAARQYLTIMGFNKEA